MKLLDLATALGLAGLLAACGQPKSDTTVPANGAAASEAATKDNMSGDMGNVVVPGATTAKGTGKVMAIDKAAGTITLDHGPIPEANWPAMTMGFKAAPGLADSIKVGDKVSFDLKLEGGSGEITAITRQ